MTKLILPPVMKDALLQDAMQRDITTARRVAVLEILWHERYLTRSQLIARVEIRLGKTALGFQRGKIRSPVICGSRSRYLNLRGINCCTAERSSNLAVT